MSDPSDFQLFPKNSQPSPGDHLIRWLIDQQNAANSRMANGAAAFAKSIGFSPESLEAITTSKEDRRRQMNEIFGTKFGEPRTGRDVEEAALGFGVGSIRGITGMPKGLGIRMPNKGEQNFDVDFPVKRDPKPFDKDPNKRTRRAGMDMALAENDRMIAAGKTGQDNQRYTSFGTGDTNVGGVKPSTARLEERAVAAAASKIEAGRVAKLQRGLDMQRMEIDHPIQRIHAGGQKAIAKRDPALPEGDDMITSFHATDVEPSRWNYNFRVGKYPDSSGDGTSFPVVEVNRTGPLFNQVQSPDAIREAAEEIAPGSVFGEDGPSLYLQAETITDGYSLVNRLMEDVKKMEKKPIGEGKLKRLLRDLEDKE